MRLRTIGLISTLVLGLLAAPLPAEAQQAGKVYRIGILRTGSGSPLTSPFYTGVRQGLHELGYIEGQNLVIEYRSIGGRGERRPEIAAELVRLKVDVIAHSSSRLTSLKSLRDLSTSPSPLVGVVKKFSS